MFCTAPRSDFHLRWWKPQEVQKMKGKKLPTVRVLNDPTCDHEVGKNTAANAKCACALQAAAWLLSRNSTDSTGAPLVDENGAPWGIDLKRVVNSGGLRKEVEHPRATKIKNDAGSRCYNWIGTHLYKHIPLSMYDYGSFHSGHNTEGSMTPSGKYPPL